MSFVEKLTEAVLNRKAYDTSLFLFVPERFVLSGFSHPFDHKVPLHYSSITLDDSQKTRDKCSLQLLEEKVIVENKMIISNEDIDKLETRAKEYLSSFSEKKYELASSKLWHLNHLLSDFLYRNSVSKRET